MKVGFPPSALGCSVVCLLPLLLLLLCSPLQTFAALEFDLVADSESITENTPFSLYCKIPAGSLKSCSWIDGNEDVFT